MSSPPLYGYSVDSSALIDLDKQYGPEFFGELWERLDLLVSQGRWMMTEKAVGEVDDTQPKAWIKAHPGFSRAVDSIQEQHVTRIMASHGNLVDPNRTREDADPFVVALALAQEQTLLGSNLTPVVLTSEKPRRATNARPKIPDVCDDHNLEWCDVLGFFRREGWRFRIHAN